MKTKIVYSIMLIGGFLTGASALSVLASWSAPLSTPPNCDSGNPGCDAPINVGPDIAGIGQIKKGTLTLNADLLGTYGLKVFNGIMLRDASFDGGGNPNGKVLTADATGVGTWKTAPSGKIVNVKYFTKTTGQRIPSGGTIDAMSFSYTPISPTNILQVDAVVNTQAVGTDATAVIKLYKTSTLIDQISVGDNVGSGEGYWRGSSFLRTFVTAGTGPFNFTVQITAPSSGGAVDFNQTDPTSRVSSITVTEIVP